MPYAPGASGNVVTEDRNCSCWRHGVRHGIDLAKLIEARRLLHEGLPAEPMHGQVPKAGIPRFQAAA
jgi:hydroxymethylglutaryl-CoA lyase